MKESQYEYILKLKEILSDHKDLCFWGVVGIEIPNDGSAMDNIGRLCKGCRKEKDMCTNRECWQEIERVIAMNENQKPKIEQIALFR